MFIKYRRHGIRGGMHRTAMEQVSPVQTGNAPDRVSPVQTNVRPEPVSPVQTNRRPEPVSPAQMNRRPEPVSPAEQVSPEQTGKNPPIAHAFGRRPGFFRGRR